MSIETELAKFDGRDTLSLKRIASHHNPDRTTVAQLLAATKVGNVSIRCGATRLLKWWCDRGLRLNQRQSSQLLDLLQDDIPWEARLHILQTLPALAIANGKKAMLHRTLMNDLTHTNKFVRTWAYNGLAVLAARFPKYRAEAEEILEMGMRDEVAAVKARLRNIAKKSGKAVRPPRSATRKK